MEIKEYSTYLTYEELLLLDNRCSEKTQKIVNQAKQEYSFGLDPFCNEILAESMKTGKLTWGYCEISCCKYCDDKPSGYHRYSRSSRYHCKGDLNYDSPFRYSGIQPNKGFIRIDGMSGICSSCWNNIYLPKLINYIIEHNLPIEIQKNDIAKTKYKKDSIRICCECGKRMYESEMKSKETMFGNSYYPAVCPHCGASSTAHRLTDEFRMLEVKNDEQ